MSQKVAHSRIDAKLAEIATRKQVKLGYNRDLPDQRDRPYPSHKPLTYQQVVDLSPNIPAPYDQGELGSCTANAISGGLQYVQGIQQEAAVMPSRLFIYYNERSMEGSVGSDSGAQIRDGIKSVAKIGYCSEDTWPYDITQFTDQPPEQAYIEAEKHQVLSYYRVTNREQSLLHCLASNFPIVFGIAVYESFMNAPNGEGPGTAPSPSSTWRARSSVATTGRCARRRSPRPLAEHGLGRPGVTSSPQPSVVPLTSCRGGLRTAA